MTFNALVLAGSRPEADPVAAYAHVEHKALIRLGGETLLARVIGALIAAGVGDIGVSASKLAVADAAKALSNKVRVIPASASPSQSVAEGAEAMGLPLLVTTVDHALLQPEWVTRFLADVPPDADIAALVAPEAAVREAAPETERSYLSFRDGRYSGCNLFYLRSERGLAMIALWRQVEADRKRPWRIAARLGIGILVRYALGRVTLDEMVAGLGRRVGVRAAAVRTPYGLAAVDVDKPADLDLVRSLLRA